MNQETNNNEKNGKEITNRDLMDMLTVLIERTNKISVIEKKMDKEFKGIQDRLTKLELDNETDIKPTLQLILENQTEVIEEKSHITVVENKQEELKDRVDVIEYAVKQNQSDIEELKKRA